MRRLSAAAVLLLAVAPVGLVAQTAMPRNPVEAGAWLKLFAMAAGGGAEATVFSEAEVEALLASEAVAPALAERTGLADLRVRFRPGEVHLSGRIAGEAGPFEGMPLPFLPPAPAGGHEVEAVVLARGVDGVGEAHLVRATVAGIALPPEALESLLLPRLLAAFGIESPGPGFPLPSGIDRLDIEQERIRMTPG